MTDTRSSAAMVDALRVERVDRWHALSRHRAEQDPVLDVDAGEPAGLERAQQLRRQEIHLREEMRVVVRVPEVVIARRIFIVVHPGERDGMSDDRDDKIRVLPTAVDKMAGDFAMIARMYEGIIQNAQLIGRTRRALFDGYLSAGFTEAQAIELIKGSIVL